MPSTSPAQERLMGAVAHGWEMPGGGGPSQAVAEEFNEADSDNPGNSEPKEPALEALDEIRSILDELEVDLAAKKRRPKEMLAVTETPPEEP